MFGSLRKKLNEVWSGADFYDKEENAKQRQQFAAQRAAPARTVSQPRQAQPPATVQQRVDQSYGGGFSSITNRLRDTFDANTKADRIRRLATSGLDESYEQEQARKTKTAQNTNAGYSGWQQGVKSFAGEVGKFVANTPGAVTQLQGRVGKIDNPIIRTGVKLVTPGGASTLLQSEKDADKMLKTGQSLNKKVENTIQQSSFGDKKDDNRTVTNIGKVGGQLAGQIATGPVGLLATGSQFAAQEANNAEAAGKSNEFALTTGLVQGGLSALSEKYGVDRFLPGKSNVTGNMISRAGKRFFTEGAQEVQQQVTSNLVANKTYNPNQGLLDGAKESFLYGGIAGGVMSPLADLSAPKPPTPSQLSPGDIATLSDLQEVNLNRVQDPRVVNQVLRQAREIGAKNGVDLVTGTPREINDRVNQLVDGFYNNQPKLTTSLVKNVQSKLTPLNEGGYAQVPFGKEIAEGLSPQQTEFINDYANMIEQMGTGNGVDINPETGTRITNNVRSAETAGKNMTKADWFDEAKRQIESGQAMYGADKDYKNLPKQEAKPKGLIVGETKTASGQVIQKIRTGKGQVTEYKVPQTLNEFDKAIGGQGNIESIAPPKPADTRTGKEILDSLDDGNAKDYFDQKEYGVKDIQGAPVNTYSGLFEKYLGVKELSEAELNQSNRTGVKAARDTVGKINPLRASEQLVGKGLEKLSRGGRVARAVNRTAQYINKTAGQDPRIIEASKRLAGAETHADAMLVELGKKAYDLVPTLTSRERVHSVLDTEASGGKLKYKDLTTQEQQAADMLRDIGDTINDASFRANMISRKKWESNRGGRYIARMYTDIKNADNVVDMLDLPDSRGLFLGMYKSRVELNDALRTKLIKDPVKLAVIRARQVRSNEALMEFMRTSETAGYVRNAPTDGYVKVSQEPGQRMHNWNGKYVRQDVYESVNGYKALNQMANGINNLLDIYDRNPARKFRKKMLTIYNPVVRTGNITSNYFFAYLNGVNPVTYQKNKMWAKKAMKSNDQLVIEARRAGLIGSDIVSRDKNMFDSKNEFMRDVNKLTSQKIGDKVKSVDDTMSNRYGKADDLAKLSALKTHVDRGYSIKQAIAKTSRGFQDYSRVGHLYDMAAKSPVFGNAFIRFQGDLYTNILKNAAVDHPARLASIPFATLVMGSLLSAMSGESEEDKKNS